MRTSYILLLFFIGIILIVLFTSREKESEMEHFALWDGAINSAVAPIRGFAEGVANNALGAANVVTKEVEKAASVALDTVEKAASVALDTAVSAIEELLKDATDELSKAAQEATSGITDLIDDATGDIGGIFEDILSFGNIFGDIGSSFNDITQFGVNKLTKLPNFITGTVDDVLIGVKASAGLGSHMAMLMIKLVNLIKGVQAVYGHISPEGQEVVKEIIVNIKVKVTELKAHLDMCASMGAPEISLNSKRKLVMPCATETPKKVTEMIKAIERVKEIYEIFRKEPQLFAQGSDVKWCKENKPPKDKLTDAYWDYYDKCNQGLNISVLKSDMDKELADLLGLVKSLFDKMEEIKREIITPVVNIINSLPKISF